MPAMSISVAFPLRPIWLCLQPRTAGLLWFNRLLMLLTLRGSLRHRGLASKLDDVPSPTDMEDDEESDLPLPVLAKLSDLDRGAGMPPSSKALNIRMKLLDVVTVNVGGMGLVRL